MAARRRCIVKRRLLILCLVLAASLGLRAYFDRDVSSARLPGLASLPSELGAWHKTGDEPLSQEVRGVLRADDLLARDYEVMPGSTAQLFIAYYRTQRAGERMHSPRNCLPGSGWESISSSVITADIGGRPVPVNRYEVEKGDQRLMILYWYQARNRYVADEYRGKLELIWDSLHTGARDGALVRVSMRLHPGMGPDEATRALLQFVHVSAPEISKLLNR